jgi:hypothetical protein
LTVEKSRRRVEGGIQILRKIKAFGRLYESLGRNTEGADLAMVIWHLWINAQVKNL